MAIISHQAPPPPPRTERGTDDWTPYQSRVEFEPADFLYRRDQTFGGHIDEFLSLWAASLVEHGADPPFASHGDLYSTIDTTPLGDCPWQHFTLRYNGDQPEHDVPYWMTSEYDVWFRDARILIENMVSNPDFNGEIDFGPFQEYDEAGNHRFQNFMSRNWSWKQAVSVSTRTFFTFLTQLVLKGYHCRRSHYAWINVRAHHFGQQQNNSFGWHW